MANHEPVRLCIGCRTRENTKKLVRVAFETTDDARSLVFDERSVLPGRGAWLHDRSECLSKALRKRAFARAFRSQVDTANLEQACNQWHMVNTKPPKNNESGSEI